MKLSRREWLSMAGASTLAGAAPPWRYAICSETFAGASFADACLGAKRCGYDGIEIDPAQLAPDPAALSPAERSEIRNCMRAGDLGYAGLHSFLRAPAGLHLTTRDASVRARSWDYFRRMVGLAADLGAQPVMALGSSRQRMAVDGVAPSDAAKRLEEGLAGVPPGPGAPRRTARRADPHRAFGAPTVQRRDDSGGGRGHHPRGRKSRGSDDLRYTQHRRRSQAEVRPEPVESDLRSAGRVRAISPSPL